MTPFFSLSIYIYTHTHIHIILISSMYWPLSSQTLHSWIYWTYQREPFLEELNCFKFLEFAFLNLREIWISLVCWILQYIWIWNLFEFLMKLPKWLVCTLYKSFVMVNYWMQFKLYLVIMVWWLILFILDFRNMKSKEVWNGYDVLFFVDFSNQLLGLGTKANLVD